MSSPDLNCIRRISTSDGDKKRRRDRHDRKRKKEEKDDGSRKKHKTRHMKGKDNHHHHKSSAKKKTKKRVSKRKHDTSSDSSSNTSSSSSFTSTERSRHHVRKRHNHSRSRSRSGKRRNRESEERHFKSDVKVCYKRSEDCELPNSHLEGPKLEKIVSNICHEKSESRSELVSHAREDENKDHTDLMHETMEQEENLIGKKDLSLEVELRQKALANFMKHQIKMDDHKGRSVSLSHFNIANCSIKTINSVVNTDTTNTNGRSYVDAGHNSAPLVSNKKFVKTDKNVGKEKYPIANDTVFPLHVINVVDGHTEEGEIIRDVTEIYTGNTHSTSTSLEKDKLSYERVEKLDHEGCREEHKLKISSNLQEEGLAINMEMKPMGSLSRCLIESADLQHEKNDVVKHNELKGSQTAAHVLQEKIMGMIPSYEAENATMAIEKNLKLSPMDVSQVLTDEHEISTGFQQKTMTVMKGGEMVQVNYKVYIPKRAAELARRRIQR